MDTTRYPVRLLDLPDLVNARDVGGLPLTGGGCTAAGVLMRCETPDLLTAEGVRRLSGVYGVRHMLDLRAQGEGRPLVDWEGIVRHRLPLGGRGDGAAVGDVSAGQTIPSLRPPDMPVLDEAGAGRLYLDMAERGRDSFVRALELLTGPRAAPAIVHCTAGKDRTGVLVAMLLLLAGVEREAIVADYAYTEVNREVMFARINALRGGMEPPARPVSDALRRARPATMEAFLDALEERHGTADAFFLAAGVKERTLDAWRARIVERADGSPAARPAG